MKEPIMDEQEMLRALEDLGMEPETIEQFMASFRLGQKEREKQLLLTHRSKVLSEVHASQDKLYSVDFLIRKL